MQIWDITIPLNEKTPVWEGDKGVSVRQVSRLSLGSDFNVTRIEMDVHTGTHMDAPFHIFDDGDAVDDIPLDTLIGEAVVLSIPDFFKEISLDALREAGFQSGTQRLLLKTRNSRFWRDDPYSFRTDFVAVNRSAAAYLVEQRVELVGIDYFSISPVTDLKAPHEILLEGGVVILENLNLLEVESGAYKLVCLPIKLTGTDGAPVRAVLIRD